MDTTSLLIGAGGGFASVVCAFGIGKAVTWVKKVNYAASAVDSDIIGNSALNSKLCHMPLPETLRQQQVDLQRLKQIVDALASAKVDALASAKVDALASAKGASSDE